MVVVADIGGDQPWHCRRRGRRSDSLRDWMPERQKAGLLNGAATDRLLEKTGDTDVDAVPMISYSAVAHLGHEAALSAMCGAVLLPRAPEDHLTFSLVT